MIADKRGFGNLKAKRLLSLLPLSTKPVKQSRPYDWHRRLSAFIGS